MVLQVVLPVLAWIIVRYIMAKCKHPDELDFTKPGDWPMWKRRFDRFRSVTKLDAEAGKIQVDTLLYVMGQESEAIFDSFVFNPPANGVDEKESYDVVVQKFDEHFIPKHNTIHQRARFHSRVQKETETVEEFVRDLYKLAEYCKFEDRDNSIRDRIVIGI